MTLVVARIVEKDIYIHSDSRISTEYFKSHSKPLDGVLKTLILSPFLSLSFAGDVEFAEMALKNFFYCNIKDIKSLEQMLYEVHVDSLKKTAHGTDFIIAATLNKNPYLSRIANRKVEPGLPLCHIGGGDENRGFKFYQESLDSLDPNIPIKNRMHEAFKMVLDNPDIKDIGDFHIILRTNHEIAPNHSVFLYDISTLQDNPEPQGICEGGNFMSLGSAAGGAHGISYFTTVSPDYHGVAIHYTIGNFGVLFCPQLGNGISGIKMFDVNGNEFVQKIKSDYGIPLRGFIRVTDTEVQFVDNRDLDLVDC